MARIINCIDCNQPISELAKMCPHCGRPWPKDGKSLIRKLSEKLFKFILSNLYYIISILIMGALLGAAITAYMETGSYRKDASYYFWSEFMTSAFIGVPTLLILMGLVIGLWIAAELIWHNILDFYLKLEYKIISLKRWPKSDQETDRFANYLKQEKVERRRRLFVRWIIASPLILVVLDHLY